MSAYLTVVVLTTLCITIPNLRLFGVIGVGLLILMHPVPTLGILLVFVCAYLLIQWRKSHV